MMNHSRCSKPLVALVVLTGALLTSGFARSGPADESEAYNATQPTAASGAPTDAGQPVRHHLLSHHQERGDERLGIGHDMALPADEHTAAVISIFGSSTSAGEVSRSVVSVMGNTRVTGPVADSAVSIGGNTYVDAKVDGDVIAVLGGVELGSHADVGGNVVSVGGTVSRDPTARVRGNTHEISFGTQSMDFSGVSHWLSACLLYGRLLTFDSSVSWAWTVALVALALYGLAAVLFRDSVERCVQVLNTQPGLSTLAALLALLGLPVLVILLFVTVIGILAVPIVGLGVLIAAFFGKLVVLAWVGSRIVNPVTNGRYSHPALWVWVGGLVMLALYALPLFGMVAYMLSEFIGIGAVVYALVLDFQQRRATSAPAAADAPASATEYSTAAAGNPRAGFWLRMGALSIDVVLVGAILHLGFHHDRLHLVFLAGYGAVMWKLKGATVGGIVCHLHVVRIDGLAIDWPTAIIRSLGCFLSLFIAGLGFIWIAIDGERQSWHDKIAGTVVVRLPKDTSLL